MGREVRRHVEVPDSAYYAQHPVNMTSPLVETKRPDYVAQIK